MILLFLQALDLPSPDEAYSGVLVHIVPKVLKLLLTTHHILSLLVMMIF